MEQENFLFRPQFSTLLLLDRCLFSLQFNVIPDPTCSGRLANELYIILFGL